MMIIKPDPPFQPENTLSNKKGAPPENPKNRLAPAPTCTDQMAEMKRALSNMPEIDDAHIAKVKAEIEQDKFPLDPLFLAQAMIDYYRR